MVRMAVATMVWSSAARNIPIIRPTRIVTIWRWVSGPSGGPVVDRGGSRGAAAGGQAAPGVAGGVESFIGRPSGEGGEGGLEVGGEVAQVRGERGDVVVGPVGEQAREPAVAVLADGGEQRHALVGEGERLGAAVVGVGPAHDEAEVDQGADLPAHGGDVGVQRLGQGRDPHRRDLEVEQQRVGHRVDLGVLARRLLAHVVQQLDDADEVVAEHGRRGRRHRAERHAKSFLIWLLAAYNYMRGGRHSRNRRGFLGCLTSGGAWRRGARAGCARTAGPSGRRRPSSRW